jgi:hypothetical protein
MDVRQIVLAKRRYAACGSLQSTRRVVLEEAHAFIQPSEVPALSALDGTYYPRASRGAGDEAYWREESAITAHKRITLCHLICCRG